MNLREPGTNATGGKLPDGLQWTHGPDWLALSTGAIVMEDLKAAEIIKSLAAGSGPADAATLQTPDVVRALFLAAESLEARARGARRNSSLPRNAGKTWTPEEDERLLGAFDGGTPVEALATAHERTRAGIEARLVKHGRLEAEQAPAARIR